MSALTLHLNPNIESTFDQDQQQARLKLCKKVNKLGADLLVNKSSKKNFVLQHKKDRGSAFIGVSKNGG